MLTVGLVRGWGQAVRGRCSDGGSAAWTGRSRRPSSRGSQEAGAAGEGQQAWEKLQRPRGRRSEASPGQLSRAAGSRTGGSPVVTGSEVALAWPVGVEGAHL